MRQTEPYFGKNLTLPDIPVVLLLVAACLLSLPFIQSRRPSLVEIHHDASVIARYPLDIDKTVTVNGHLGPLTIRIEQGAVTVLSSTCPGKQCMHAGSISTPMHQLVCAPNHIMVMIRKSREGPVDAIAH
jgi:hypothetical protein